jgi:hypothetical protein
LLAGCDGVFGLGHIYLPGDSGGGDGRGPDAFIPDAAAGCYGTGKFVPRFCFGMDLPRPGTSLPSGVNVIDTTNDTLCTRLDAQTGGPQLCVIFIDQLRPPAGTHYRVVGSRPLVIVARDTIELNGVFDGASYRIGGGSGPASGVQCQGSGSGKGGSGAIPGGGGAGGTFVGAGGNGGPGGVSGGVAAAAIGATVIRGGCDGGDGGSSGGIAGPGGAAGGGGLYFVAGQSIVVSGAAAAFGAGGNPGNLNGGGAGGGAGGLIGLDAPMVTVLAGASLRAGGGGGGEGGSATGAGNAGGDGDTGAGGTGSSGGDGGDGKPADGAPGTSGNGGGGGGGGGGGAIVIVSDLPRSIDKAATIVPPPTP